MKRFLMLWGFVIFMMIAPGLASAWDASGFDTRITGTANKSMISGSHSQMSICFQLNVSGLDVNTSVVQVYLPNGTRLAVEKEHYADPYGLYWIGALDINDTVDYEFLVYYDNPDGVEPDADSTYGSEAVWDSNYVYVSHMADLTTSSIKDSTSNGRTSTKLSANNPIEYDAPFGKAQDFSSDYITIPDSVDFDFTDLTFESYHNKDIDVHGVIMSKFYDGSARSWEFLDASLNDRMNCYVSAAGTPLVYSAVNSVQIQNWYYTAVRHDDSSTSQWYVDGVTSGSAVDIGAVNANAASVKIGDRVHATSRVYFDGKIAEVRLSNFLRSTEYISTTSNNLHNPTSTGTDPFFLSFSEEESASPVLNGTFLYPNSTYSIGYYGSLKSELVYETGINFSDLYTFNLLSAENMEYLSIDDTNYIPSIDKDAAHDGYMYGNFSLHDVETVNFIRVKTVHNRIETNPVILGLFNVSTQKWHAVNNSSVENVDVELTYNITGTDILKYTTLEDNVLNLSVSLNTNGDGNYDVFVDFVEVYIDYEEVACPSLECVYNLVVLNQNNISILQNDVEDLKNNVNNLYLFVMLCTVFLVATLRKRRDQ